MLVALMLMFAVQDTAHYDYTLEDARYKTHEFRLKVSAEEYNGERRTRINVMSVVPINYTDEIRKLMEKITTLQAS